MNQCNFTGRFSKDPELKKTKTSNKSVMSFTLAVRRDYKDKEGKDITDWVDCVAWGPTAEFIDRNCKQGTFVRVSGSLENVHYEKDGKTMTRDELKVKEFEILAQPNKKGQPNEINDFSPVSSDEGTLPFSTEE